MTNGVQSNRDLTTVPDVQAVDQVEQLSQTQLSQTQRDAEGYNVAPTAVDDITRAQQEAAAAG